METIEIRNANVNDCEQMLELIKELALFEKAPEQVTVTLDHFKESGFGQQPVWWAVVATAEKKVVAMALYYIRYSTWKGQRMYLEDIIVTEKYRGKGIGHMLMDRLINISKEKNMCGIMWQVLDWNTPAIEFYKKYNSSFDAEWINCSIENA